MHAFRHEDHAADDRSVGADHQHGNRQSNLCQDNKNRFIGRHRSLFITLFPKINTEDEIEQNDSNANENFAVTPVNHMKCGKSTKHSAPDNALVEQNCSNVKAT